MNLNEYKGSMKELYETYLALDEMFKLIPKEVLQAIINAGMTVETHVDEENHKLHVFATFNIE